MQRRALVLGAALNMLEDVDKALELSEFDGVIAAKGSALHWPGHLDAWVTLHPERAREDISKRAKLGFPRAALHVCHEGKRVPNEIDRQIHYLFPTQDISGSSGLFAVKVALELGYTRVVLCGVPLENKAGKLDQLHAWAGEAMYRKGFEQALPYIAQSVRSMSGWTAQLLGRPTRQWLGA